MGRLSWHESLSPSSLTDSSRPAASVSGTHIRPPPSSVGLKQAPPAVAVSAVAVSAVGAFSTVKIASLRA